VNNPIKPTNWAKKENVVLKGIYYQNENRNYKTQTGKEYCRIF